MSALGTLSCTVAPTGASKVEAGVSGFIGLSTSAWPGRKSAAVLLGGCNMRCPYCNCPEMLGSTRSTLRVDDVMSRIAANRGFLGGVVVSGGEPTAHPLLKEVLWGLKSLEVPVKIDTNGVLPQVLSEIISEGLVSFVALDVKTTPQRYDSATRSLGAWAEVRRSISLLIASGVDHEFRTTCYPSALQTSDLPAIARELEGGRRYALQQFRPQRTLDPGASSIRPYPAEALRRAALCCSVHLPTVVRGV